MLEAGRGKIVNTAVSETTMRRGLHAGWPSRAATDALFTSAADLAWHRHRRQPQPGGATPIRDDAG
jgi:hypothetical protein